MIPFRLEVDDIMDVSVKNTKKKEWEWTGEGLVLKVSAKQALILVAWTDENQHGEPIAFEQPFVFGCGNKVTKGPKILQASNGMVARKRVRQVSAWREAVLKNLDPNEAIQSARVEFIRSGMEMLKTGVGL